MTDFRVEYKPIAGSSSSINISQVAHGFVVGNIIYYNGSAYALARADVTATAEVLGMVSAVANANSFTLTLVGYVSGLSGLTPGENFLSPSSAGALTPTEPSTIGQISKPIFFALSATTGYLINYRGEVINFSSSPTKNFTIIDAYTYAEFGGF